MSAWRSGLRRRGQQVVSGLTGVAAGSAFGRTALVATLEAMDGRTPIRTPEGDFTVRLGSDIERYRIESFWDKEPETLEWLRRTLTADSVLFDVGANVGLYSLYALVVGGPGVRAVCFEPSALNFPRLCLNLADNGLDRRATALAVGLGARPGIVDFELSDLQAGSALHDFDGTGVGTARRGLRHACPVWALDDVVRPPIDLPVPSHLKVDVDGPELAVLEGGGQTLRDERLRHVLIEVSETTEADVVGLLGDAGLRVDGEGAAAGGMRNLLFARPT